jgi:hypothetical protein
MYIHSLDRLGTLLSAGTNKYLASQRAAMRSRRGSRGRRVVTAILANRYSLKPAVIRSTARVHRTQSRCMVGHRKTRGEPGAGCWSPEIVVWAGAQRSAHFVLSTVARVQPRSLVGWCARGIWLSTISGPTVAGVGAGFLVSVPASEWCCCHVSRRRPGWSPHQSCAPIAADGVNSALPAPRARAWGLVRVCSLPNR